MLAGSSLGTRRRMRYGAATPGGGHRIDGPRTPAMKFLDMTKLSRLLLALLVAGAATVAAAQERGPGGQGNQERPRAQQQQNGPRGGEQQRQGESRESVLRLLPADSVTEHTIDI